MALSFDAVQKAYEVFNELKKQFLPELCIPAWPDDLAEMSSDERNSPLPNMVYGFDKKSDDGWENLLFYTREPSQELIDKFDQLKTKVPNSSISRRDKNNPELWIFGWF